MTEYCRCCLKKLLSQVSNTSHRWSSVQYLSFISSHDVTKEIQRHAVKDLHSNEAPNAQLSWGRVSSKLLSLSLYVTMSISVTLKPTERESVESKH